MLYWDIQAIEKQRKTFKAPSMKIFRSLNKTKSRRARGVSRLIPPNIAPPPKSWSCHMSNSPSRAGFPNLYERQGILDRLKKRLNELLRAFELTRSHIRGILGGAVGKVTNRFRICLQPIWKVWRNYMGPLTVRILVSMNESGFKCCCG